MAGQRTVSHYSEFLRQWGALVGIPVDRLTSELAASANSFFQTAIQKMWTLAPWMEVSPYGEARFLGNRISYGNNLANTTYWTATAITATANSVANPADGNVTATSLLETVANSAHKVVQSVTTFYPSTQYNVSVYCRPNGRAWQYISVFDGVTTYSAFFNTQTGTVGTATNFTTTTIAQQPGGFWVFQGTFTANAAATTAGTVSLQLSTDGSTLSYAGDVTKGAYFWGAVVQQASNTPVQDLTLYWNQLGESAIDACYNMWPVNPFANNYPPQFGFNETPLGLQVINGSPYQYSYYVNGVAQNNLYAAPPNNPIYIYYRQVCPNYTGDQFSTSLTYSGDQQVYFTSTTGYGDFYKCIVATAAGQSPDTNPNSWVVIPLYMTFLQYTVYQAYGDWLISDGAMDKAQAAYVLADDKMNVQFDLTERQMDAKSPLIVNTHLSSRATW